MSEPSPAGDNGRGPGGRFQPGNRAGKGNPNNAKAQRLRNALLTSITSADVRSIIRKMITLAEAGDVQAAKLVFDRALGSVQPEDVLQRIEAVEAALAERADDE